MAVFMIGQSVLNFVRQSSLNLFSHRVKHEVRTATYQRMQRLDMDFFNEVQTGELMSILSNDTNRLERFLDNMFGESIQLGVLIVGISVILFWFNPQLAVITLGVIPVAAVFTYWFMRLAEERYTDVRQSVGDLNSRLENNLNGIEVIKSANTDDYEDERVREHSYTYFRLDWLALRLNFIYRPGLQALTSISFIATFVIAHRLSTVWDADTILVVEDGRIVERGTHDDLIDANGLYANLWRVQAGEIGALPEEFLEEASQRVAQQGLDGE